MGKLNIIFVFFFLSCSHSNKLGSLSLSFSSSHHFFLDYEISLDSIEVLNQEGELISIPIKRNVLDFANTHFPIEVANSKIPPGKYTAIFLTLELSGFEPTQTQMDSSGNLVEQSLNVVDVDRSPIPSETTRVTTELRVNFDVSLSEKKSLLLVHDVNSSLRFLSIPDASLNMIKDDRVIFNPFFSVFDFSQYHADYMIPLKESSTSDNAILGEKGATFSSPGVVYEIADNDLTIKVDGKLITLDIDKVEFKSSTDENQVVDVSNLYVGMDIFYLSKKNQIFFYPSWLMVQLPKLLGGYLPEKTKVLSVNYFKKSKILSKSNEILIDYSRLNISELIGGENTLVRLYGVAHQTENELNLFEAAGYELVTTNDISVHMRFDEEKSNNIEFIAVDDYSVMTFSESLVQNTYVSMYLHQSKIELSTLLEKVYLTNDASYQVMYQQEKASLVESLTKDDFLGRLSLLLDTGHKIKQIDMTGVLDTESASFIAADIKLSLIAKIQGAHVPDSISANKQTGLSKGAIASIGVSSTLGGSLVFAGVVAIADKYLKSEQTLASSQLLKYRQSFGGSCGAATSACAIYEFKSKGRDESDEEAINGIRKLEKKIYQITASSGPYGRRALAQASDSGLRRSGQPTYPSGILAAINDNAELSEAFHAEAYSKRNLWSYILPRLYPKEFNYLDTKNLIHYTKPHVLSENQRELKFVAFKRFGIPNGAVHIIMKRPDGTILDTGTGKNFGSLKAMERSWQSTFGGRFTSVSDLGLSVILTQKVRSIK